MAYGIASPGFLAYDVQWLIPYFLKIDCWGEMYCSEPLQARSLRKHAVVLLYHHSTGVAAQQLAYPLLTLEGRTLATEKRRVLDSGINFFGNIVLWLTGLVDFERLSHNVVQAYQAHVLFVVYLQYLGACDSSPVYPRSIFIRVSFWMKYDTVEIHSFNFSLKRGASQKKNRCTPFRSMMSETHAT